MRALLSRRRLLLWGAVAVVLLMGLPSISTATPEPAVAPSVGPQPLSLPTAAPAVAHSGGASIPAPLPVLSSPHPTLPRSGSIRFHGAGPAGALPAAPAAPAATKTPKTGYVWSSAYVGYGPPPPSPYLMLGEGAGIASDNALDETVWFGGQGSGGLSNVTFQYWYYLNTSDPINSQENSSFNTSVAQPSARTNASFSAYQAGGAALLFGGLTDLNRKRVGNDTWLFYFANATWRNITSSGAPPPRESAAFAIDQKDGLALMFGGIAPQFSSKGVTGTVIWGDTWEFRFSTGLWTELATPTALSGRFGASMVWDPVQSEFLLYGGCSFSCDGDAWSFSPTTSTWTSINELGQVPAARAGASFAWDPGAKRAVLFGGYAPSPGGDTQIYGDTYEFNASGQWTNIAPAATGGPPLYQPGPLFDASTTWSNFPGCNAMWITGGNPSLSGPPELVYVIQPANDSPAWQCWTFLSEPQGPPQAPPPCSRQSWLVIDILDLGNHSPIPNALVHISGQCLPASAMTGPTGSVNFTTNTPDNLTINVSATGFHGNSTWYNYTYTNTTANTSKTLVRYVLMYLVPFPTIDVQVQGLTGGPNYVPVEGADVYLNNSTLIAVSGPNGWGNSSALSCYNTTVVVSATAYLWSTSWKSKYCPYTGNLTLSLVILRAGFLRISVVNSKSAQPIAGASGIVYHDDPGLPTPFNFTTNGLGNFSTRLPLGNYSATAQAYGYLPNRTANRTFLHWITNATIVIRLDPELGSNESVRLLDARTLLPIARGQVVFGGGAANFTDPAGWYNGTNLLPPGTMAVIGRASGYLPNSTTILVNFNTNLPPLTIRLKPDCEDNGTCSGPNSGGGSGGSPFFPAGGSSLFFLLGAPAFLAIIGAGYAIGVSARRARGLAPVRAPPRTSDSPSG